MCLFALDSRVTHCTALNFNVVSLFSRFMHVSDTLWMCFFLPQYSPSQWVIPSLYITTQSSVLAIWPVVAEGGCREVICKATLLLYEGVDLSHDTYGIVSYSVSLCALPVNRQPLSVSTPLVHLLFILSCALRRNSGCSNLDILGLAGACCAC